MKDTFGVDLGNVIIDHRMFGTTESFVRTGDYNLIPPVKGALEALRELNTRKFKGGIFLVYRAKTVADEKIRAWLTHHKFFSITGIPEENVHRASMAKDKARLCDILRATHFVDDRLEVLSHIAMKIRKENLFLFNPQETEISGFRQSLPHVRRVMSWSEILKYLLP